MQRRSRDPGRPRAQALASRVWSLSCSFGLEGSGLLDDDGVRDQVLPATAALVDEDPDEPEVEDGAGDPQADKAEPGRPPADPAAVPVAHDPQTERAHPEGLTATCPEPREVQQADDDRNEGQQDESGHCPRLDARHLVVDDGRAREEQCRADEGEAPADDGDDETVEDVGDQALAVWREFDTRGGTVGDLGTLPGDRRSARVRYRGRRSLSAGGASGTGVGSASPVGGGVSVMAVPPSQAMVARPM